MFRLIYISYFTLHYFIDIIVVICSVKVYSVLSLTVYLSLTVLILDIKSYKGLLIHMYFNSILVYLQ